MFSEEWKYSQREWVNCLVTSDFWALSVIFWLGNKQNAWYQLSSKISILIGFILQVISETYESNVIQSRHSDWTKVCGRLVFPWTPIIICGIDLYLLKARFVPFAKILLYASYGMNGRNDPNLLINRLYLQVLINTI